jgi:hypothetical protein
MRTFALILFASFMTAGCATTPSFDKLTGVTPKTIVDVIECEIIAAKKKNAIKVARDLNLIRMGRLPRTYPIRDLKKFVAVAELTLQVDAQATLLPSFTQTDLISKTLTRAFDYGVKLDSQSHRVYSETVNYTIVAMSDDKNSCEQRRAGISLNGKLGIEEVVDMAFGSIDPDDQGIDLPDTPPDDGGSSGRRGGGSKAAFGTSLEFSLLAGVAASGVTFTLVHFKGPGRLFSGQRADTHKVTISFARTKQDAMLQNLLINNETLPTSISRKIQMDAR